MSSSIEDLRAGDWVEVKSQSEIAKTLDADGTLDGLPFMPEMLEYCGRRYRVRRYTEKTCVEVANGVFTARVFHKKDILHLEGLRCSGADHDGCQRLCLLFWKRAWLRKVATEQSAAMGDISDRGKIYSILKTKETATRYFCQSTQLHKLTHDQTRNDTISQCIRDLQSGAVGMLEMAALIAVPLFRRIRDRIFGRPRLLGALTRTPVEHLNLQPGDIVEVKSLKEMEATLDSQGRNRGLVCDVELGIFCGKKYRVLSRLDRMIAESTGQMRKMEATVTLEDVPCLCAWAVGGCPRSDLTYFREIWLKKVDDGPAGGSQKSLGRAAIGSQFD